MRGIWVDWLICAFAISVIFVQLSHSFNQLPFLMLTVNVVVARFLNTLLFAPYWRCIVTEWNIAFCFSSGLSQTAWTASWKKKKKIASFSSPPNNDMLIASDCCFVLVDLTWSTFCVHIFRRQLQTNMAVRLCDVASLLRSGSWAPEPWTGVCGTSYFEITWARRPAFCQCSGHTNDVSSQSYFDNQIKMFHLEFGPFLRFCLRGELTNV